MKRSAIFLMIAILATGSVFAQSGKDREDTANKRREANSVTIDGTLKLEKGFVAVQSGDSVYLVPLLNRYINFINGLKEGARVSIEGITFRNIIMPRKAVIEGKSYDFIAEGRGGALGKDNPNAGPGFNPRGFSPQRNNFGPGHKNAPAPFFGPGRNNTRGPHFFGPGRNNAPTQPRVRPGDCERGSQES